MSNNQHGDEVIRVTDSPPITAAPVCPGCGAEAIQRDHGWETAHDISCSWLSDPDSEAY